MLILRLVQDDFDLDISTDELLISKEVCSNDNHRTLTVAPDDPFQIHLK